jgi:tRNA(Leu) C34 or U34 (ribose-2'-O)-methylase TrmL
VISAKQIVQTLSEDGVDFDTFYASAYESDESTGGWMPLESAPRYNNPFGKKCDTNDNDEIVFNIPPPEEDKVSRRIDIKLFRRPKVPPQELREATVDYIDDMDKLTIDQEIVEHSSDALMAISKSVPGGKLEIDGYFGIGILQPKTEQNVGTLWRSAFQLGASVLYTIGGRYKTSSSDTLNVPARIPMIELDDWSSFAEWAAPKGAVWVAIEMGGIPLKEFKHPRNAIYILGSEDHGVPKSILRNCREVVSLESEQYGSYNVAVAGSLVMYDRMMKQKQVEQKRKDEK